MTGIHIDSRVSMANEFIREGAHLTFILQETGFLGRVWCEQYRKTVGPRDFGIR